jgi:hypothetical protein
MARWKEIELKQARIEDVEFSAFPRACFLR